MQNYPEYSFKGAALGSLEYRNRVLPITEVPANMPTDNNECYTTIARFTEDYLTHVKNEGTVQGFSGPAMVDIFWIDVDDTDLNTSLLSTLTLLTALYTFFGVDERDVKVYFSGKKGFHVGVNTATFGVTPSPYAPKALGLLARRVAEQAGVTIDQSIYKVNSLLRLPNSVNGKSGLYKIPLAVDQIGSLTIPEIQELANGQVPPVRSKGSGAANDILARLYTQYLAEAETSSTKRTELPVLNTAADVGMPRWHKVCVYRMSKGVPSGHRNEVALRLAVDQRQRGTPIWMAEAALLAWNEHNEVPLDRVDILDVVQRSYATEYDYGCHDPIMDRYCHKECHLYPKKYPNGADDLTEHILSIDEARDKYLAYIRESNLAKVSWGIDWLDRMTRQLAPGQVGLLMARAGVGKTALVINTIRKNSLAGIPSLFCSLEQLAAEVWERMAQVANEVKGDVLEAHFQEGNPLMVNHLGDVTSREFAHAYICEKDRLTVAQLKDYVRAAEKKSGQKIRLLVVDYIGRMRGEGRDQYSKMSELAVGVKEVAKECELAVVVICQVNRTGGKGSKEVTMDMARDSGQIEEAVDYAVGLWRSCGEEEGSDPYVRSDGHTLREGHNFIPITVQINKNRKGPQGEKARTAIIFRPEEMRFEDEFWTAPGPSDCEFDMNGEMIPNGGIR